MSFFLKWWKRSGYLQKFLFRDMFILWWYAWVAWSLWRKPWSVLDFVTEFWVIFFSVAIMTSFGYCCRVAQYWTSFFMNLKIKTGVVYSALLSSWSPRCLLSPRNKGKNSYRTPLVLCVGLQCYSNIFKDLSVWFIICISYFLFFFWYIFCDAWS